MYKFYFAGAIRGGREKVDVFIHINELLEKYGEVLDKHVANPNVNKLEENFSLEERYLRDLKWINECDMVIAEVSTPSLGVGYEVSYAVSLGKKVIALCDEKANISAMIGGNNKIDLIMYKDVEELLSKLDERLKMA